MNAPRLYLSLRPAIVFALALALLLASTLGLVHGTLHGHAAAHESAAAMHVDALGQLFDGHDEGDTECRLYDQLSGGLALPGVPLVVLPLVLPKASLHFFLGEALARWAALYDARGSPVTR